MINQIYTHFCLFAGAGGMSYGLSKGHARIGVTRAQLRCVGGIDSDPYAVQDFTRLTGTKGTCLDLFDRYDYERFHGEPPPLMWKEATPADILEAAGGIYPDILALSPPCKGFSGLLNNKYASSGKYDALNSLTIRGLLLALAAFQDDPPSLIIFENVPRIQTRGRAFLDIVDASLRSYGYSVAHTVHDCGKLGGLGQTRTRFLLVARHTAKVPPFLYEPPMRRLKSIGEILENEPLPGTHSPMHVVPRLTRKTWIRLAMIEAGKDWRSLRNLEIDDKGFVKDYRLSEYPILDPRSSRPLGSYQPYGVAPLTKPSHAITAQSLPGTGSYSIPDPTWDRVCHNNVFRLVHWDHTSNAITAGNGPSAGGLNVSDPRPTGSRQGNGRYRITKWDESSGCVLARSDTHQGAAELADPRWPAHINDKRAFANAGHYGVNPWGSTAPTIISRSKYDAGRFSVADPRWLNAQTEMMIISPDDTWHRPLTTYELAILQGFPSDLELSTSSHARWRQRIGNAVPPPTAEAIGNEMATTLLLNELGESFQLSSAPIWVQQLRRAIGANL